jgi:tetratricopeptide (TPR) repeat protein
MNSRRKLAPNEVLTLAQSLHASGAFEDAAQAYRHVLRQTPENVGALTGLGLLNARQGNPAEAEKYLRQALARAPDAPEAHTHLGGLLLALQRPQDALACFETALRLAPAFAEAHHNHARALAAIGRLPEAIAGYRRALVIDPSIAAIHQNLARAYAAAAQHAQAAEHFARALALGPPSAPLHNDYGTTLAALGRTTEAAAQFRSACDKQPDFAVAHSNLGNALMAVKRYTEAVASYRTAIALDPTLAEAHANLGSALMELAHPDDALPHLQRAQKLDPGLPQVDNALGHALVTLGDLQAARIAFKRAIAANPAHADYYAGLATTTDLAADDPSFLAMERMAANMDGLSRASEVALHFALFRGYEKQGRIEQAFAHLCRGNALRREAIPYDEGAAMAFFERLKSAFTTRLMRRAPSRGATPDMPIFILGMPRSGSTLVEQILTSHQAVGSGGELMFMADAAAALGTGPTFKIPYPQNIPSRSDAEFAAMGAQYRRRLAARAPGFARITDKMPANFHHVGLIRLMLPNARIIHTRRNPADTCFSCFAQTFLPGLPYTNDLAELGRYYRAYAGLMAHWREVLPEPFMLEVDYEDLVTDFEPQIRRILAYCGLEWNAACLDFHRNTRPVLTASNVQVRQPLYRHALARAEKYGTLLQPLLGALA